MSRPAHSHSAPRILEIVRVSTRAQADRGTPEVQRHDISDLRTRRPGTLVERIDEAISGSKDAAVRSDLKRLFELAAARAFDEVRVWRIDRLTRHDDPRERAAVYGAIRDAGAVIVEATGRVIDPADEMGELDLTLQGWFAAREKRRIVERTQGMKKLKAQQGRLAQGQPPFGRTFDKRTGKWGYDPVHSETYRKMFGNCLERRSLKENADILNREGRVTRRGMKWTGSNVCKLLRDPAAYGRYLTHGHEMSIPPIVDEDTFRTADRIMRLNNCLSGPKPKVFALLRKLAVCGVCGAPVYMQLGGGSPSRIRYYYCRARSDACLAYHRVEEVDAMVMDVLREWLTNPKTLAQAAGHEAETADSSGAEVAAAKAELRALDKREENLTRLLTKGLTSRRIGEKQLEEIRRLRSDAEAALASAEALVASAQRRAELGAGLAERIATLRLRVTEDASPQDFRDLMEIVFPRGGIHLFPDGKIELRGTLTVGAALPKPSSLSGRT